MTPTRVIWIDASAGIAGDMLLGAIVHLGVPVETLQAAVDAVLPGAARLRTTAVTRAGLRAVKVDVEVLEPEPRPARTWPAVRALLEGAELADGVRRAALGTFERLATAEGRVHGVPPGEVHFHEVGAVDAVADVVGVCAGLAALDAGEVVLSPVALGAGTVRAAHGRLPVPVPAVLELARGWAVVAGHDVGHDVGHDDGQEGPGAPGELATPTGLALATTLARGGGALPAMRVEATGVGAGSRDRPDRPNVVRLVLGTATAPDGDPPDAVLPGSDDAVLLETNVDDLDPRVWPDVLGRLLDAGALDAWLTPILMKKGRPAHTLHVLARPDGEARLADVVLAHTSTLGVRRTPVGRHVLDRAWTPVEVPGGRVRIKVGHRDGTVRQATPEYEDVAKVARAGGVPVAHALALAQHAAVEAGLVPGAAWPRTGAAD